MKKLMALAAALVMLPAVAPAQPETLFDQDISSGGYGGPALKTTPLNSRMGLMMGASGAWIINSSFNVGLGGYGLVTDVAIEREGIDTNWLAFAYGGLILGYQLYPDNLLHLGVQALIGGGGVGQRRYWRDDPMGWEGDLAGGTPLFVLEPGVTAELNISRLIRLQLEGSYRFVDARTGTLASVGVSDDDLSGASATLTLKFGSF